ncbi:MAG: hypothetical protein U0360_08275 [Dehalococcoidia bacterium]
MPELSLRQSEARLLYLAALYHLGRPGSEVDAATRQPLEDGLAPVAAGLQAQSGSDSTSLTLTDFQLGRLGEALLGLVNELKQIGISGRSVTPRLFEELTRLYPEVTSVEPSAALDLAGEATLLRRRLESAVRASNAALAERRAAGAATAAEARRTARGWRFWRR